MTPDADVLIVGAGPAGAAAAIEAARLGVGRILLVDKARFPRPKTCAGGLSPGAVTHLKELGVWEAVAHDAWPVSSLRLVAPNGRDMALHGSAAAWVLERRLFDDRLAKAAVSMGVEFREGACVRNVLPRAHGLRIESDGGAITSRWVIAADGAPGRLNRDTRPRRVLRTCLARFEGLCFEPHRVEMVFDRRLLPDYGWLFPESASRANIGLCLQPRRLRGRKLRDVFDDFLRRQFGARLSGAVQVGRTESHPISVTTRVVHRAPPGVLLAGEANRLVDRATGEGISFALRSGMLAARAIAEGRRDSLDRQAVANRYRDSLRRAAELRLTVGAGFQRHGIPLLNGLVGLAKGPLGRVFGDMMARI